MGSPADIARHAALEIVRTLAGAGHVAYFAGGCVRDELLGLEPTDYDVATDATPKRVRSLFRSTAEVGASFGVVLVRVDGVSIEVATFRDDGPYTDKRRPDAVHFSDPEADARRRDFTINALFLDPLGAEDAPSIHGHVIDHVGGMADLDARLIRAVGDADARLDEDHLRALRAVRLASRLGFEIDQATADAIRRDASELRGVSRERIGDEIRRMLAHPSRTAAAARIEALSLDAPIFNRTRGAGQPLDTLACLDADAPVEAGLAAWALDRGCALDAASVEQVVTDYRDALCLSNQERDNMQAVLFIVGELGAWADLGVAARKRLAAREAFRIARGVFASREPAAAATIQRDVSDLAATPSGLAPDPLISGEDLISLGLSPGPAFRRILDAVYDAQLEDRIADREAAMELVRRLNVY